MNRMQTVTHVPKFFLFVVAAANLFSAGCASAAEEPRPGEDILLNVYHRNMGKLDTSSFGLPRFLESLERDDGQRVDVYGIRSPCWRLTYAAMIKATTMARTATSRA
jgi:hypothetical protein